jgi:hypothetical protein
MWATTREMSPVRMNSLQLTIPLIVAYKSIEALSTLRQGRCKAKGANEHRNHRYMAFKLYTRSATCIKLESLDSYQAMWYSIFDCILNSRQRPAAQWACTCLTAYLYCNIL